MIKKLSVIFTLLSAMSGAYACGAPLTLSGPVPVISSIVYVGESSSYTYTVTNNTNHAIPVTQTVTGNSHSTYVTTPCTFVPAGGRCDIVVTIQASVLDYLLADGIQDTLSVNYAGRLPAKLTSSIHTTVAIPALATLTVTPSATSYAGTPTTLADGYVTYIATATTQQGAILDLTPLVTWNSTDESVATAPDSQGRAYTFFPSGSTDISATFGGVSSNTSPLQVNSMAYVAQPVGGAGGVPNASPWLCSVINATTGVLSSCATVTNHYTNLVYTAINSDARYIYMSNQTGTIYSCPLNASTGQYGISSTCTQIIIGTSKIAAIKFGLDNKLLYALAADGLYACQVTQATGALSGCTKQTANLAGSNVRAFSIDPNGLYMYLIANASTQPYAQSCSINQTTGALVNCVAQSPSGINTTFTTDDITSVNTTDGTYIYGSYFIAGGSWDGNVLVCRANTETGVITNCSYSSFPTTMYNPVGVSLSNKSTGPFQLYVADGQNGLVHNCAVGSDFVTFSNCFSINSHENNAGILVR